MSDQKVAVVTGGASGIGKCIVEEFRKQGVKVYVIDKATGYHYVGDISNKTVLEAFARKVISETGGIDYLLKPIPYARFSKAIAKARKILQNDIETEGVDYMLVKVTQTKRHKILFRDITYIEAQQNYCDIHRRDDTSLMVRATLNNILEQLPSDMFCQVHRSFIVNKTRITSMDSSHINIDGVSIPVSRTYKEKLL